MKESRRKLSPARYFHMHIYHPPPQQYTSRCYDNDGHVDTFVRCWRNTNTNTIVNTDANITTNATSKSITSKNKKKKRFLHSISTTTRTTMTCWYHLLSILFLLCSTTQRPSLLFASAQPSSSQPPNTHTNQKYEWEEWNYYQILGLSPVESNHGNLPSRRKRLAERNRIKAVDIKKAYRQQAQQWHPDKWASRKKLRQTAKDGTDTAHEKHNVQKKQQQQQGEDGSNNHNEITVEECTARFAKIAEAYEILKDEEKKEEYDHYLVLMEEDRESQRKHQMKQQQYQQQQQQHQQSGGAGSGANYFQQQKRFFNNFRIDAKAVFEDFFYGGSGFQEDADEATYDPFHHSKHSDFQSSHDFFHNKQPSRISEATQVRYDPRFRTEVHRVLHREEYDEPRHGRTYFRVVGQEFVEELDRVYGHSLGFMPVSEPYLVEEGYVDYDGGGYEAEYDDDYDDSRNRRRNNYPSQPQPKPPMQEDNQKRTVLTQTTSKLHANQYITPDSHYLRSPNHKYYAGLTPDCELVVMQAQEDEEDTLVWTSESYVPPHHQVDGCFLAIYGSRLAVVVGGVGAEGGSSGPRVVLWNSPAPPRIVPSWWKRGGDGEEEEEEIVEYYASLDDDGSLALYKRRRRMEGDANTSRNSNEDDNNEDDGFHQHYRHAQFNFKQRLSAIIDWWSNLIRSASSSSSSSSYSSSTRAANAWKSVKQWAVMTLRGKPSSSSSSSFYTSSTGRTRGRPYTHTDNDHSTNARDECIYASGPAGCLTPGRYMVQLTGNVKRSIGKTMGKLDDAMDDFMRSLSEESEYDDDVLDTLIRVVGKVGSVAGKAGMRMGKQSLHEARMVVKMVRDTVRERMGRLSTFLLLEMEGHGGNRSKRSGRPRQREL